MRHADGGGVPHGVSPRMVGSDLARIWDGSGVDLGWICEDLGLDLRGSWAGSSVVAVEISAKKCKKM